MKIDLYGYKGREFLGVYAWGAFNWQGLEVRVKIYKDSALFSCDFSHLYPDTEEEFYTYLKVPCSLSKQPMPKEDVEAFIETALPELERALRVEITRVVKKIKTYLASAEEVLDRLGGNLDSVN